MGFDVIRRASERITNESLRELCRETVEREGIAMDELARRIGWCDGRDLTRGDGVRLQRTLGMLPSYCDGGRECVRRGVNYPTAVQIVLGCGANPGDYGL